MAKRFAKRGINSTTFANKIEYIYFNLVSGKWNLAKDYLEYKLFISQVL
ncbi:MAG: hypothetical protein ACTHM7_11825 [Ginsengibacter sp.]